MRNHHGGPAAALTCVRLRSLVRAHPVCAHKPCLRCVHICLRRVPPCISRYFCLCPYFECVASPCVHMFSPACAHTYCLPWNQILNRLQSICFPLPVRKRMVYAESPIVSICVPLPVRKRKGVTIGIIIGFMPRFHNKIHNRFHNRTHNGIHNRSPNTIHKGA